MFNHGQHRRFARTSWILRKGARPGCRRARWERARLLSDRESHVRARVMNTQTGRAREANRHTVRSMRRLAMNNQKYADFTHIRRASRIEESPSWPCTFASGFWSLNLILNLCVMVYSVGPLCPQPKTYRRRVGEESAKGRPFFMFASFRASKIWIPN